ncbi:hypothetical protein THASP1DRAFT_33445 [Thamnocephalis sphaerospora]|uniref:CP-type G domain-containing protein n=1 Tax=Thamnocephalis sphaerospora TaxID=78915 RepID=A0A4P9XHJ4_9FUNG|nr:hypothetical protein THASP1DRAFT_33445 [Thamnocephalis sphaerospora]|eukprot:RKP04751.1 hypothetical protein THASP1DRAFT_33445 [Thamnocephalis sphaerospora]
MGRSTATKNTGLGKSIMRARFGKSRRPRNESDRHTTEVDDGPNWVKMQSITQENDLDEFLRTAQLAGTEFTAGKPHWDETTTREELQRAEREDFLDWRRGLAELQDEHGLILTPFEKNIEVWRQLWRVVERSDLVVQIVDARNPLFFYSTDLEKYVHEIDTRKRCLLLVNKADMLTARQRHLWADYFEKHGIQYLYFSALKAGTATQAPDAENEDQAEKMAQLQLSEEEEEEEEEERDSDSESVDNATTAHQEKTVGEEKKVEEEEEEEERIRVLSAEDLADCLMAACPSMEGQLDQAGNPRKVNVGLVGYPNVGKSSTINALVGAKRVAVGSTPGKTKHFQTIHLDENMLLCDCPGLVFPSFATTQAEMVCDGVLPIDQLREYTGPVGLLAQRIPKWFIEATYGIRILIRSEEEGGTGVPTAEEVLVAYATARGFMRSSMGSPDESRAARYVLKDYVNGKLLFCHPPPDAETPEEFNRDIHNPDTFEQMFEKKKVVGEARQLKTTADNKVAAPGKPSSRRVNALDSAFFSAQHGAPQLKGKFAGSGNFSRVQLYPHQARVANDGTTIRGPATPGVVMMSMQDKKKGHKKGKKHVKHRHRDGYDI